MNGQNATQKRTILRHNRIQPYDRSLQRKISDDEIDLAVLEATQPIPIGSTQDFCDFIGVCHYGCFRSDAQYCGDYQVLWDLYYGR